MNDVTPAPLLCIGSVLWDVIGHAPQPMRPGADVPGHIRRLPGGVALNIARGLAGRGLHPTLLSAVGRDAEGDELIAACAALGLITDHIHRPADLPTDVYMAIEDSAGLIAAIAAAHTLEAAGARILAPLTDGPLGRPEAPFAGLVALDGNLTEDLLGEIAGSPAFALADLRVAPASPGKALRLRPFLGHARATLYVNLEEAGLLCDRSFAESRTAAAALHDRGGARVLVTDGPRAATVAASEGLISLTPPTVTIRRVTGAGDTFMASHIAAELVGAAEAESLACALEAAAKFVSGESDP
ncbi:PfkB family carbohydrate kinase [Pseudodonghicola flavimaris]|uniref:PfkB family carbohydrate kinase n=1 Tax=Pseudodonghicola flavimaris TaxID=3050036 RepID=A0ABT7F1H9_9RHOB|nr:PfkB family carbohydrate kinase [Pseudodonghicola flavimaris]MDK3018457.1 PfkB family carbohydrate kinase [Pseudodonghicola flavimaris]